MPPQSVQDKDSLLSIARAYVAAGISVIPINRDGTKRPPVTWKRFQETLPTDSELTRWFGCRNPYGIAIIGGAVSGALEILDFDRDANEVFPAWCQLVESECPGLVDRLSIAETPGNGYHVRYRCPDEDIPGNTELAVDPTIKGKGRVIIETRGEGGYALTPGSPAECHETGRPYIHKSGPVIPQAITPDERELLCTCARYFDRNVKQPPPKTEQSLRPGDDFNRRGPDWLEILDAGGWSCAYGSPGGERRWRRPGKDRGWSATTGHCTSKDGTDLFRVFSSNAAPFDGDKCYSKFGAYTLLNHDGDYNAAAKALLEQGYGQAANANRRQGWLHEPANRPNEVNGRAHGELSPERQQLHLALDPPTWPEPPDQAAFAGLAGEIIARISPHTEADEVALLGQFLVAFGNATGRNAYRPVGASRHYGNLYMVLVGSTAKGRKGSSWSWIEALFARAANSDWTEKCVQSGLSSGEGLIAAVRDEMRGKEPVKKDGRIVEYTEVVTDHGIADKRLLVVEEEFASVLRLASREHNILSTVLRQAWDAGKLRTMTKNNPLRATDAHVSLLGHITRDELVRLLTRTDASNGFANRFLWLCVRRSKFLPDGGENIDLTDLQDRLSFSIQFAKGVNQMQRDAVARDLWHEVYPVLSRERPGVFGLVTNRAEAQVLRLSILYALLDESDCICERHLESALAFWDYTERSCKWIFGESLGNADAEALLAALRSTPEGMTHSDISTFFGKNKKAEELKAILSLLLSYELVIPGRPAAGGKPAQPWKAVRESTKATKATKAVDT